MSHLLSKAGLSFSHVVRHGQAADAILDFLEQDGCRPDRHGLPWLYRDQPLDPRQRGRARAAVGQRAGAFGARERGCSERLAGSLPVSSYPGAVGRLASGRAGPADHHPDRQGPGVRNDPFPGANRLCLWLAHRRLVHASARQFSRRPTRMPMPIWSARPAASGIKGFRYPQPHGWGRLQNPSSTMLRSTTWT